MGTPVTRDERVDVEGMRRLTRHMLQAPVGALFVMGSMGGGPFFTPEEMQRATAAVVEEAAGKVPVLVGVSDVSTKKVIRNAQLAKEAGADAVVATPPLLLRCLRGAGDPPLQGDRAEHRFTALPLQSAGSHPVQPRARGGPQARR